MKRVCGVPCLCNNPVGPFFIWQVMRKRHQRVGALRADGFIGRHANTILIYAPFTLSELPVFCLETAQ